MKIPENNPVEKKKDEIPFRDVLIRLEGEFSGVKQFEKSKDFFVREERLREFEEKFEITDLIKVDSTKKAINKCMEYIKKSKELFKELGDKYNIQVVPFKRVIGKDKFGEDVVYTITKKVEGERLSEKYFEDDEKRGATEQLENLYSSLLDYHKDVYKNGGYLFYDLCSHDQYIWSQSRGEKQSNIYLVDIHSIYTAYYPESRLSGYWFFVGLEEIKDMIIEGEKKIGGVKFKKIRKKFLDFLDLLEKEQPKELEKINNRRKGLE